MIRVVIRLREWMGVDYDTFYHSGYFAAIPMDFIFRGMENQVICHLARVLLKNGINRF